MVFLHTALVYEVLDLVLLTDTISVLLFGFFSAPNRTPLAHMEEALQHIINHFSDVAKNFGLTISLKKTKVLYQ